MADETNSLSVYGENEQQGAMEVRRQVNEIQYLMTSVLKDGTHFGKIKGCGDKPTLLQPGAEKIAYMFHLVPSYQVEVEKFANGHRAYTVTCSLRSRESEKDVGYGVGLCSTLESKYRYRNEWVNGEKRKVENQDVADVWNTCLKMAKKRAFVDAVKSTTAASDVFTQDVEDFAAPSQPAPRAAAPAQAQPARHVADLSPVRARFKVWCAATGLDPKQGAATLAASVDAATMQDMTPAQVARAVEIMDRALSTPADVPADVDAETGEVVQSELYPEEVEF